MGTGDLNILKDSKIPPVPYLYMVVTIEVMPESLYIVVCHFALNPRHGPYYRRIVPC